MPYNILCLDGGGSWDLIQAMALKEIYGDIPGHEVLAHFDLVVANSGGSLVAAALAEGLRPSEVVALIKDETKRKRIFSKLSIFEKPVLDDLLNLAGIGPRYSADRKFIGLNEALPNTISLYMSEVPERIKTGPDPKTHFMICGYDYQRERAVFFRSDKNSMAQSWKIEQRDNPQTPDGFSDVLLHQAIHASSNAPVNYFNKPAIFAYRGKPYPNYFWDGAIGGFNNPILVAIIEARCNGYTNDQLRILSIGTGNNFLPINLPDSGIGLEYPWLAAPPVEPSFVHDLPKWAKSILSDPPDSDTFISYSMLFPDLPKTAPGFVRLNPLIQPILRNNNGSYQWTVPDGLSPDQFQRLIELDMDAVEQDDVNIIENFCTQWIAGNVKNQPIRTGANLACILGHSSFKAGKDAWNSQNNANEGI